MTEQIKGFHRASRQLYGAPRIHQDLKASGYRIGLNRVARLMRLGGIRSRTKPRFVVTAHSQHNLLVADNKLNRDFKADQPNQKWVADITYVWTWEGWLYLAVVVDLCSRKVVGWAMEENMAVPLVDRAFVMASSRLAKVEMTNLLFHSDRGSQYASNTYCEVLRRHNVTQSMSRKGNCWDNAVAESFFATLKKEEIHRTTYRTRQQAKSAIFSYIEGFYNTTRRHSYLGGISPLAFERQRQNQKMRYDAA